MECGNCGWILDEGQGRCPHCGEKAGASKRPKGKKPWSFWVGLALIAIAGVAAIVLLAFVIRTESARNADAPYTAATSEGITATAPSASAVAATAPRLEDAVMTCRQERIQYTDDVGNEYDARFDIPAVLLDSADARACNAAIQERCMAVLNECLLARDEGYSLGWTGIHYSAWLYGDTVTLLVTLDSTTDCDENLVYTLDMTDGHLVERGDMAARLGVTEEALVEAGKAALEKCFRLKYGTLETDTFYHQQLERTLTDENLELSTFYWDQTGQPAILARVYSLAGGDYYEELVPVILD